MKNIFVSLIAVLLFAGSAFALSGTTKANYTGCLKKEWIKDMVQFKISKDFESFKTYLKTQKCIILKKGLRVTITESPGVFGTTTGIVIEGIKLWTEREALIYSEW